MVLYTEERCLDRLEAWYHWRQNWAYAKIPAIPLPAAMPLDRDTVPAGPQLQTYGREAADIPESAERNTLADEVLFPADEYGVQDDRTSTAHGSTAEQLSDTESFTSDIREDGSATAHLSSDEEFPRRET